MNKEKLFTVYPNEAEVGDYVGFYWDNTQLELIDSIEHNYGIKDNQCRINDYNYNYADIIVIRIKK